jgi:hypothetical protein
MEAAPFPRDLILAVLGRIHTIAQRSAGMPDKGPDPLTGNGVQFTPCRRTSGKSSTSSMSAVRRHRPPADQGGPSPPDSAEPVIFEMRIIRLMLDGGPTGRPCQ